MVGTRQRLRISRSLFSNILKRKFKAILRPLYDSTYRRDLQTLRSVVGDGHHTLVEVELPLYMIHSSHAINYPDWVNTLVGRMYDTLWHPPLMKVIKDEQRSRDGYEYYMVVDGNHRLAALKILFSPGEKVRVILMVKEA